MPANVQPGDSVYVFWGQWRVHAVVTKVTKTGTIYAKRWNNRRNCWTKEQRLYPHKGVWSTQQLAGGE